VIRGIVMRWLVALLALAPACALAQDAEAPRERRVALVIGINDYQGSNVGPLNNAVNDAVAMAAKLQALGFELAGGRAHVDVTLAQMNQLMREFGTLAARDEMTKRPQADVALLYFAGHGIGFNSNNYLLPRDVRGLQYLDELPRLAFDMESAFRVLKYNEGQVKIFIVDACRNTPIPLRGQAGTPEALGLMRLATPPDSLVAYAVTPGEKAIDAETSDPNSPGHGLYTGTLLRMLERSELRIEDQLAETTKLVRAQSNGIQVPMFESKLERTFMFGAPPATRGVKTGQMALVAAAPAAGSGHPFCSVQWGTPAAAERDCAHCPAMVQVPQGAAFVGSVAGKGRDNERPRHGVRFVRPLEISAREITFAQWDACVAGGGCRHRPGGRAGDDLPVVNVSWQDAADYAAWLSRTTQHQYRLPTEHEFEYAARGGGLDEVYWTAWKGDRCHGNGNDTALGACADGYPRAAPAGSFEPNCYGLHDTLGNVWEWVQDCAAPYPFADSDGAAHERPAHEPCTERVARGGGWDTAPEDLTAARRLYLRPGARYDALGFRVVRVP
jgi:formylglycine-generating enzyme required for sulfatase activity